MQFPPPLVHQPPPPVPQGRKRSGLAFGYLPQRPTLPPGQSHRPGARFGETAAAEHPYHQRGRQPRRRILRERTMTTSSSRPASVSRRGRARAQTGTVSAGFSALQRSWVRTGKGREIMAASLHQIAVGVPNRLEELELDTLRLTLGHLRQDSQTLGRGSPHCLHR